MTLSDLSCGMRVRIVSVRSADPAVQRLMLLGLVEGTEVKFLQASLGQDPLEFQVHGASISMRRAQADSFEVSPIG